MSTTSPVPSPRTRRAREVERDLADLVRRLRAAGVDVPLHRPVGPDRLEATRAAADAALAATVGALEGSGPERRGLLAEIVVGLHDTRRAIRALRTSGRTRPADAVDESVARLRNVPSTLGLLDRVCAEAAACTGLGRVVLSTVAETTWSVCRLHGGPGGDREVPAPLIDMAQGPAAGREREVLRSGSGMVVTDVDRTSPMAALFPNAHVVVPVPLSSGTIGLLHADHHPTDRPVDEFDRDVLEAFARAFGQVYERTALQERLDRQRRVLSAALSAESQAAEDLSAAGFAFPGADDDAPGFAGEPDRQNAAIDALLTPREREVLELILGGASNSMIAERLVITTGTVKSHVKRVLRKLGAANRSEAISRYLEFDTTT